MSTAAYQVDSKWFGGGYIFGIQTGAPGTGQAPSVLLPSRFSTIQEANVDITLGTKELRGIYEDPEDVATASRKITGKITTGRVNLQSLNYLIFGESDNNFQTGTLLTAVDEAGTVGGSYHTVTVTHSADFAQDLGVRYAGTRTFLEPTTGSSPAQGQYTYAAGVYTFNAADADADVLISYQYTSTTGHTLTLNNLVMGSNVRPTFSCLLENPNEGDQALYLYECKATKIGFPIKQEDYVKMEIDFTAFANGSGQVLQWLSSF